MNELPLNKIIHGDCLEVLKTLPENSVDSICCDPPYELGFMGKSWDNTGIANNKEMWAECLRVLKPGGHLLAFSGTRTYHRMAVAIEDAGFDIRDQIAWCYGQGFPKSLNVFKQLKKKCECGNMEVYENRTQQVGANSEQEAEYFMRFMQETDLSQTKSLGEKQGKILQSQMRSETLSGTLQDNKQREEPKESSIRGEERILERGNNLQKTEGELQGSDLPEMSEGISTNGEEGRLHNATQASDGSIPEQTINENGSGSSHRPQSEQQQYREPCAFCKQWGTQATRTLGVGTALKPSIEPICVARKPIEKGLNVAENCLKWGTGGINIDESRVESNEELGRNNNARTEGTSYVVQKETMRIDNSNGKRFPANLIHDNSEEVRGCFPETKSVKSQTTNERYLSGNDNTKQSGDGKLMYGKISSENTYNDSGNASRFFKSILYVPKASKSERNKGCEGLEIKGRQGKMMHKANNTSDEVSEGFERFDTQPSANNHPTVKPIALMEYLIKMVTPKFVFVCERCYNGKYEKQKTNSETSPMQKLRGEIQTEGQLSQGGILHQEMCVPGGKNRQGEELPILQKDIHSKKDGQESTEILQPILCSTGYGNEKEGENSKNTERLFGDIQAREQNGEQTGNGNATQNCNGGENGEGFTTNRGGASYKSQKRRQQGRELNDNDSTGTQQNTEVKKESSVSSLSENRRCPNCGESMVKRAGVVLDPFAGSGSTLVAAKQNGYQYIGIELTYEYIPIIEARLDSLDRQPDLFDN